MVKRVATSIITLTVLIGVLVACGGTTIVVAPTPEPEPTPEPTPETLSIEEKEYYRQICEDTLGVPPISWKGCSLAIEVVSQRVSSGTSILSKDQILLFTSSWFQCEAVNRLKVIAQPPRGVVDQINDALDGVNNPTNADPINPNFLRGSFPPSSTASPVANPLTFFGCK